MWVEQDVAPFEAFMTQMVSDHTKITMGTPFMPSVKLTAEELSNVKKDRKQAKDAQAARLKVAAKKRPKA